MTLLNKWVERLLDPSAKQARYALATMDKQGTMAFCCLGHLVDVNGGGAWYPLDEDEQDQALDGINDDFDQELTIMEYRYPDGLVMGWEEAPSVLLEQIGFDNTTFHGPASAELISLNDVRQKSLQEIGVWVAEHVKGD